MSLSELRAAARPAQPTLATEHDARRFTLNVTGSGERGPVLVSSGAVSTQVDDTLLDNDGGSRKPAVAPLASSHRPLPRLRLFFSKYLKNCPVAIASLRSSFPSRRSAARHHYRHVHSAKPVFLHLCAKPEDRPEPSPRRRPIRRPPSFVVAAPRSSPLFPHRVVPVVRTLPSLPYPHPPRVVATWIAHGGLQVEREAGN
uniref:Uncharacterized protein n=1 Tax=Oryza punctata TaxID=4537 RepID=A0A0E0LIS1_ORYPU